MIVTAHKIDSKVLDVIPFTKQTSAPLIIIMTQRDQLANKCINMVCALSIDQIQAAQSGHPGAAMGCAPMAHLLWGELHS